MKRLPPRRRGFTLLEAMLSIGLLAVLLVLAFALGGGLKEKSQMARCVANLKRIGEATSLYVADHDGVLPHYTPSSDDNSLGYATVGAWYWHLAPYFGIARLEDGGGAILGPDKVTGLPGPVVYTCPAQKEEGNAANFERFFNYPSLRPVSYAPNGRVRGKLSVPWQGAEGRYVAPIRLREVERAAQKVWLSDAPVAEAMNISDYRWQDDCADKDAHPRWGFSRHGGGGNALFFDGRVQWISLTSIREGDFSANLRALFFPYES